MHNEQPMCFGNAPDGVHEALASHALSLEVRWFLSSRNGDDFEIVDQDFEVARFFLTGKTQPLEIAKERAKCVVWHWIATALGRA